MSRSITRSVATGLVLAGAAITAGGIFCFPLYAPILAKTFSLTQPQLSTIALAGMSAQYPLAAVIGSILDTYGTWVTAAMAAVLFSTGWGWFSYEVRHAGAALTGPSASLNPGQSVFRRLVACYFLCGVGTAASLFTVQFSASQAFPGHTGISTGASTAFFGLSPLFLSIMAAKVFTSKERGLNVGTFVFVLALSEGVTHLIASAFLRIFPPKANHPPKPDDEIDDPVPVLHAQPHPHPSERTPLLDSAASVDSDGSSTRSNGSDQTVGQLLKDPDFWLLAFSMLLLLGSIEMLMANIGTIVLGLPETRDGVSTGGNLLSALFAATDSADGGATQVRLISFANTCGRLLTGPLADYLAPAPLAHPSGNGERYFPRKRYFSRIVFMCGSCALMTVAYLWMAAGVISQADIYFVSIAAGLAYGATFTVAPSIVGSLWLGPNAGRNFGIVTYAPFFGTPAFSYLYAFISASHQLDKGSVCTGTRCWKSTFWIATVTTALATVLTATLLKRRRNHA